MTRPSTLAFSRGTHSSAVAFIAVCPEADACLLGSLAEVLDIEVGVGDKLRHPLFVDRIRRQQPRGEDVQCPRGLIPLVDDQSTPRAI